LFKQIQVRPDIPHKKHCFVCCKKSCSTCITDLHWELKSAFGHIPQVAVFVKTESDLLVFDHVF